MKYHNGNSEYLVSDPRLTVSEAAAKQKPKTLDLVASITEPFGLGEVFAQNDIAILKSKLSGECRGILSRAASDDTPTPAELDAFMTAATFNGLPVPARRVSARQDVANVTIYDPESPARGARVPTGGDRVEVWYQFAAHCATACGLTIERQWMNFAVYGSPWTVLLNDAESSEDHMRRALRFRVALQQVLGPHGPQSVHVSYVAGEATPLRPVESSPTPAEREREALRAELAKPPRGVSVEQWHAVVASKSEGPQGQKYAPLTPYELRDLRFKVERCGLPERIMKHAPAAKKNWWE